MTREEILINSIWTSGKMNVHSKFFKKEVRLDLFTSDYNLKNTDKIISEKFVKAVNDFLNLPVESKSLMKILLYKHCIECCENTSYGFEVLDGETESQANLREFGITDEESAFEKSNIDHVVIDETDQVNNRFVKLVFYPEWEDEHGCELILRNGILLDHYGESGGYIRHFDYEE
ncbi:hypothetical protein EV196_101577 [Mariniflexile fucanivorans]|uniref:DUF6985 domain-containing protein n=1 Tax=Mariniflexile fucanivorans TaxID=264023 RepID=A0A4R1RRS5_9FLAO|nr:hypothetical protein [Mariniflexile fucanivorans]TCL69143.1 hypothetical protein EV196_101577 [Mariniflexile fucanivorans]